MRFRMLSFTVFFHISRTTFQLTNDVRAFLRKPRSLDDIKVNVSSERFAVLYDVISSSFVQDAEFEGSFHNGERVYGRVLWHPSNELSPGYRLWIEKLYLCAGRDGYVPLFEPNAERPQFGCLENSQRLKYRLLLLVSDLYIFIGVNVFQVLSHAEKSYPSSVDVPYS